MQQNKTQAKTHAHKQSSIKKQTGCCATQIILNCCETVFQNSPSIKETTILFKKIWYRDYTYAQLHQSLYYDFKSLLSKQV